MLPFVDSQDQMKRDIVGYNLARTHVVGQIKVFVEGLILAWQEIDAQCILTISEV